MHGFLISWILDSLWIVSETFQIYNIQMSIVILGHEKSRNYVSSNQKLETFLMCDNNLLILWCLHVLIY